MLAAVIMISEVIAAAVLATLIILNAFKVDINENTEENEDDKN